MTLLRSERGAIMITCIFMVCFLVAMLYVVTGLGRTLLLRDGMQDAADAAAYSSAILNARGMNLVVFINLLMAGLVAVLVALRIAQTLLLMGAAILAGLAWASFGSTAPLAAQLSREGFQMGERYKDAKEVIEPILKGLHTTSEAVSVVVPWVAMTSGMTEASLHHHPASGAFALPGSTSLPVEPDKFSVLCGHATEVAVGLAFMPVEKFSEDLVDRLKDAAQGLGETTAAFLCGDGSSAAPTHTINIEHRLPRHPKEQECNLEPESAACETMEAEMRMAEPDTTRFGKCTRDCSYFGPYETMARAARGACESLPFHQPKKYVWQRRRVDATFVFDGSEWVERFRRVTRRTLENTHLPPCGHRGTLNDKTWNKDSGKIGADEPDAVCAEEVDSLPAAPVAGAEFDAQFDEAARIFSCTVDIQKTYDVASKDDVLGAGDAKEKSPQRIESDVELGDEAFQIRAIAFGEKPAPGATSTRGVELALHQGPSQPALHHELAALVSNIGRLSVAQSEFYFDHKGDVPRAEWMWNMRWSARLKHFRLPSDKEQKKNQIREEKNQSKNADQVAQFGGMTPGADVSDSCRSQGGSGCGNTKRSLSIFDSLVRH